MNKEEFYIQLKDALQTSLDLTDEATLDSIPEYDSLGKIILISLLHEEFGFKPTMAELNSIKTPLELWNYIQKKI